MCLLLSLLRLRHCLAVGSDDMRKFISDLSSRASSQAMQRSLKSALISVYITIDIADIGAAAVQHANTIQLFEECPLESSVKCCTYNYISFGHKVLCQKLAAERFWRTCGLCGGRSRSTGTAILQAS
jgi:hypothetical protein